MINVIDIFDSDKDPKEPRGEFLGAVYNTFRESFGENVYVISCTEASGETPNGISKSRDTYIVVGSLRPLDLSGLPGEDDHSRFSGTVLKKDSLDILTDDKHAGRLVLTDDFAPVEYLLRPVVQRWMW